MLQVLTWPWNLFGIWRRREHTVPTRLLMYSSGNLIIWWNSVTVRVRVRQICSFSSSNHYNNNHNHHHYCYYVSQQCWLLSRKKKPEVKRKRCNKDSKIWFKNSFGKINAVKTSNAIVWTAIFLPNVKMGWSIHHSVLSKEKAGKTRWYQY